MQLSWQPCVIIPVYNHERAIVTVVEQVRVFELPIILVNDGSSTSCVAVLEQLAERYSDVELVNLPENRGKGGAVKAGLREAWMRKFTHALQIDADGQHNTADIPALMEMAQKAPEKIILGRPVYDASIPKLRFYARYLTHVWVYINTLSLRIKDSMCGFRVYPVAHACKLVDEAFVGSRMDFDIEVLVRWLWRGGDVVNMDTHVTYPLDGVSHFALVQDNVLITKMHTRLFFGMLWRWPKLLWYKFWGNE